MQEGEVLVSKDSTEIRIDQGKDYYLQLLLSKFLDGEINVLVPFYDPEFGPKYVIFWFRICRFSG